jgi:hypothetical protein
LAAFLDLLARLIAREHLRRSSPCDTAPIPGAEHHANGANL